METPTPNRAVARAAGGRDIRPHATGRRSIDARPTGARPLFLVGNPNVGKSVLFGVMTGRYVNVSNYPGTTIEVTRGAYSGAQGQIDVVDTPGTNHLIPMSEDERVTRDILLAEAGGTILQVGDAKNLRRTLALTVELSLLGHPTVLVLNMMDEARSLGIGIDRDRLERSLGIPVVETIAIRRQGLGRLRDAILRAAPPRLSVHYPAAVEKGLERISALLPETGIPPKFLAILLLAGDRTIVPWLRAHADRETIDECERIRLETSRAITEPLSNLIQRCHLETVDRLLATSYRGASRSREGWKQRFGEWSIHPLKGLGIIAVALAFTFWFVGLLGAGTLVDLLENGLFGQVLNPLAIRGVDAVLPFPHEHARTPIEIGIQIPVTPLAGIDTGIAWSREVTVPEYKLRGGLTLFQEILRFIHDLLVGPYGIITMALAYGFAIVLPIVATFFLLFSFLEDSGYLPRLAIVVNDLFRAMGLNGRAVLPMVLGLGCDTMATLTTRILDTRKQRIIVTLLLALGVPCSAQLGVLLAMMTVISPVGTVIWLLVVTAVMVTVGWLSSKLIRGRPSDFLLEIPPIRRPMLSNIVVKTLARIEWYLREVLPLFVLGTLILFLLDRSGFLVRVRDLASPLVQGWLRLPRETTDAFLIGFLRRDYGAIFLLQAATGPNRILTGSQIVVSMVVITLFIPCIANVFVILKEHGIKIAAGMVAFIFPLAFLVGGLLARVLRLLGAAV